MADGLRAWWGWVAALLLAACAPVLLVPPYDEQIDAGLTSLYADTSSFVERMIALKGTPAGEYAANTGFYDDADGRVEALIVRAEANRVLNNCPTAKVVNAAFAAARLPADVRGEIGTLPRDDCQVVLMRLIKTNFKQMREFHEGQEKLGIPPAAREILLAGGVGASLRAAIHVEVAKRAKREE